MSKCKNCGQDVNAMCACGYCLKCIKEIGHNVLTQEDIKVK